MSEYGDVSLAEIIVLADIADAVFNREHCTPHTLGNVHFVLAKRLPPHHFVKRAWSLALPAAPERTAKHAAPGDMQTGKSYVTACLQTQVLFLA